ncbi:MAG: DUF2271 domain-containing protein, partial [Planctomycetota bacterium]
TRLMRQFYCCVLVCGLLVVSGHAADEGVKTTIKSEPVLKFAIDIVDATGDPPMIVIWVERTDGAFVKTLQMLSKDKKYYPDITAWETARNGKEKQADFDAVVGATIKWGQSRELIVPITSGGVNLLAGNLVLRIEQRKDKGGHYRKRKIPLTSDWPGVTLEKEGYIKKMTVTVTR